MSYHRNISLTVKSGNDGEIEVMHLSNAVSGRANMYLKHLTDKDTLQVLLRLELRSLDSESRVLTITP